MYIVLRKKVQNRKSGLCEKKKLVKKVASSMQLRGLKISHFLRVKGMYPKVNNPFINMIKRLSCFRLMIQKKNLVKERVTAM